MGTVGAIGDTAATLALAYEQRTANLQRERDSYAAIDNSPHVHLTDAGAVRMAELQTQIDARLGFPVDAAA